jgi:hypothetical protein
VQGENERKEMARLGWRMALAQSVAVLLGLFGLGCICLVIRPDLFGISGDQPPTQGWLLIWLLSGGGLLAASSYFFTTVTQWRRRLIWVLKNVSPSRMRLVLREDESSGSSAIYARLDPVDATRNAGWRVKLWAKPRNIRRFLNTEFIARVYFDPGTGKPAVIAFDHGILWAMTGNGSTEKIG